MKKKEQKEERVKDRDCIYCRHFTKCDGKPKEVAFCIMKEIRKEDER